MKINKESKVKPHMIPEFVMWVGVTILLITCFAYTLTMPIEIIIHLVNATLTPEILISYFVFMWILGLGFLTAVFITLIKYFNIFFKKARKN